MNNYKTYMIIIVLVPLIVGLSIFVHEQNKKKKKEEVQRVIYEAEQAMSELRMNK
ncbi:hypothetical protein [Acinetobacter stercoris]|uniref:Uncharacterized protein n=1 Tax=Acinetobacter stercoris TaxID=2126983 RepID=A0A2U3N325_9GAMM|nr:MULTISPECIES: hypothetical protein [Acinetobacter]SPL72062.1 hypothetical protein KPC_3240 [Acinetobacter stercoris]